MPVTFGLDLPLSPGELPGDARTFYREALSRLTFPFTTIWANDHFQFGDRAVLECWTALTLVAGEFPQFNVGNLVLGQSYRNPALLAKMAATLQYLSAGRLILGLGAGWHEEEYRSYNYEFLPPGQRLAQLDEVIQILRRMWTGGPATFHGTYYSITDAYCEPPPDPPIPLMIGTTGRQTLRLVAREADAWNANVHPDRYAWALGLLRQACEEIGRDISEIRLTAGAPAHFPNNPADFVPSPAGDPPKLGPSPRDAVEQLQPFLDLGVTHFQIRMRDLRTIDLFVSEVAPVLSGF